MSEKVYMTPNPPTPNKGQKIDAILCNGCNSCVEICPTDVFMPNPQPEKPPIILYPEECWFCGACIEECGTAALSMAHPLSTNISVNWVRKDTGAHYRLGMKNPPPPNRRPPSGGNSGLR